MSENQHLFRSQIKMFAICLTALMTILRLPRLLGTALIRRDWCRQVL